MSDPGLLEPETRQRLVEAAEHLMSRRGVRDVSMEDVAIEADVSLERLQRHFPTKETLAQEFLRYREEAWTVGFVEAGARARGTTPEGRLLAIFDVFNDWFQRTDFEACSFINVLIEMGKEHPLGIASREYLANIRTLVETLATEAGLEEPEAFARSWHILMKGSIISAVEGDTHAAKRAQRMARDLIKSHTPLSVADELEFGIDKSGSVAGPPPRGASNHFSSFDWWELEGYPPSLES